MFVHFSANLGKTEKVQKTIFHLDLRGPSLQEEHVGLGTDVGRGFLICFLGCRMRQVDPCFFTQVATPA